MSMSSSFVQKIFSELFNLVTKLSVAVLHLQSEGHAKQQQKGLLCSRSKSQWSKDDRFYCVSWTNDSFGTKTSLMTDLYEPKYPVKILDVFKVKVTAMIHSLCVGILPQKWQTMLYPGFPMPQIKQGVCQTESRWSWRMIVLCAGWRECVQCGDQRGPGRHSAPLAWQAYTEEEQVGHSTACCTACSRGQRHEKLSARDGLRVGSFKSCLLSAK